MNDNDLHDLSALPVACPGCGHQTLETIRRLCADNQVICACGAMLEIKIEDWMRTVASTEELLEEIMAEADTLRFDVIEE